MKKKIFFGIGIVVIFAVVIMITAFLVLTKSADTSLTETVVSNSYLEGTWRIAQRSEQPISNEYFVFDKNSVSDYRNGQEEAYLSSSYSVLESGTLSMSDVSKEFIIEKVSDNILKLIDTENKEVWSLLRCSGNGLELDQISEDSLDGDWNVLFHGGQAVQGETMTFNNGKFTDYRDGNEEPYLESEYKWNENGNFIITALDREIEVVKTGDNTYGFIETDTGYIWEIEKKS